MAKKRVLIIRSEKGFRGGEWIGPLETFDRAGYDADFASPNERPVALRDGMEENLNNLPPGRSMMSAQAAAKVRASATSPRLEGPLSLPVAAGAVYYQKLDEVETSAGPAGVACYSEARDLQERRNIIRGKRVTGHCRQYNYKDGRGHMWADVDMDPPYPLKRILRDATGPAGASIGNFGHQTSITVDYPFIAGRSTPDSYPTGQKMVDVLEKGLTRCGW